MLPAFRQRDVLIHWDGAPGVSHPEMTRIVSRAADELRAIPGIRNVGAHVGRAIMSDERTSVNAGELWVSMDQAADYDQTMAAIQSDRRRISRPRAVGDDVPGGPHRRSVRRR